MAKETYVITKMYYNHYPYLEYSPHADTKASEKLVPLLSNAMLCKDIGRLFLYYQTSSLESYHSVINHFAPKSTAFSYHGMECRYIYPFNGTYMYRHNYVTLRCHVSSRIQLAALHFNENANREQAMTKAGEHRFNIVFPKYKKGGYIVRKVTKDPTYGISYTCKYYIFHCY